MDKVNYKEASHSKSRLKKDYIIGSVTNIVRHLGKSYGSGSDQKRPELCILIKPWSKAWIRIRPRQRIWIQIRIRPKKASILPKMTKFSILRTRIRIRIKKVRIRIQLSKNIWIRIRKKYGSAFQSSCIFANFWIWADRWTKLITKKLLTQNLV